MATLIVVFITLCYFYFATAGYQEYDLVVMKGKFITDGRHCEDEIAFFHNYEEDDKSLVTLLIISLGEIQKDGCINCEFHQAHHCSFPSTMLAKFTIKSFNQSSLTREEKEKLMLITEDYCSFMVDRNDTSFWRGMENVSDQFFLNVFFAHIVKKFGLNGLFYVNNKLFDSEMQVEFVHFYQECLRLRPRLLADAEIARSVQKGDLVKVKRALKQQKNEILQAKAVHFYGSFGRIITSRKNKRNQTEFAIQSLFDKEMKLALRPKYLFKISKIYLHARQNQRLIEENQDDVILYLPYFWNKDDKQATFGMNKFQNYLFAMNHRKSNIIIDPVISISYLLLCWYPENTEFSATETTFRCLPFYLDKVNWPRIKNVIGRMKKTSKHKERQFIEGIEKLFNLHFDKIMKSKYEEEIPVSTSMASGKTYDFYLELEAKIQKDLRKSHKKNVAFYHKLLDAIAVDAHAWIVHQHPEYWQEIATQRTHSCFCFKEALEALYRISVIRNYLQANAKGRDLHVIYHREQEITLLRNLTAALSAKIDTEWNVNNTKTSDMLVSEIVVETSR